MTQAPRRQQRSYFFSRGAAAAAVLTLAILAFAVTRRLGFEKASHPPPAWSSKRSMDELAEVRSQLQQMRMESAALRLQLSSMAQRDSAKGVDSGGPVTSDKSSPPQSSAGPSSEEQLAHIEVEFVNEPPDPQWNPDRDLRGRLADILPQGSALRSLECRRTMCRMETSHRDLQDYTRFSEEFLLKRIDDPLWRGATVFDIQHPEHPGEEVVVVAYLGRDSLPGLPN